MEVDSEYKELVDLVAKNSLDFEFPNSSEDHARYVISKIIESSKNNVSIFSDSLNHSFLNNKEVATAINNNKKVDVKIITMSREKTPDFFKKADNVIVKDFKSGFDSLPYFIVADKRKVRLCARDAPHKARVNFYDKKRGERLHELFEKAWGS